MEGERYSAFGPASMLASENKPWRFGRHDNGQGRFYRMPFMPRGSEALTPFARIDDGPADLSDPKDKNSLRVGKFTHPSGAPDNHLLTVYSPGPANHQYTHLPQIDGGIYLLKDGKPIDEPAKVRLKRPIDTLKLGTLTVRVKDRQGNISKIVRTFCVGRR